METKTSSIKTALLCLDNVTQRLLRGEDVKSSLFQFCLQIANYCEQEGHKDSAKSFRQRADILKKMTKNIFKVYNQEEFLELMKKKIKKHSIIIFDERGRDIYDSKSLFNLEMAKLINKSFSEAKKRQGVFPLGRERK